MAYVDGFVLAVPKRKLDAYRQMSRKAGKVWRDTQSTIDPMPFDVKRMSMGGFSVLVDM